MARHKSRSLEIWQLGLNFNAAKRCVQTCSNDTVQIVDDLEVFKLAHTFSLNLSMDVSFLRYHLILLPRFNMFQLLSFGISLWCPDIFEMMTCILKAHYINLTSMQMRQLLGVYQFAELREEALITTFFRIIVPWA